MIIEIFNWIIISLQLGYCDDNYIDTITLKCSRIYEYVKVFSPNVDTNILRIIFQFHTHVGLVTK